ncbi:hypothetical protein K7I13_11435 [Brucepastera parasyntrophica]|uniref:hypothetical protein n=1 Tax=Brucepastera parasyntrophica TaxID=2880008 RepID=UPI002109CD30|nr:hypothetical protein [Brucepastera parasyntrophica]ULQ59113.1 hypothetical protein K7I13_11435 [Brucepastera parasyntrophica]
MAKKKLLEEFSLKGDLIDQISEEAERENTPVMDTLPPVEPAAISEETQAATVTPEEVPAGAVAPEGIEAREVSFSRDGLFHVFRSGDISYRIGGVKPLFVTSLRVNIRAANSRHAGTGGVSYYDSIDLYAARGRVNFAQGVYRTWGAVPARVEQDLILILEKLEAERDAALVRKPEAEQSAVSEADRRLALELLEDANLFDRIADDLTELGYVGEELNKQLMYICASSRKLDDPISVMILSQSASGKSFLVDTVKRLMPPEEVVAVTSLSDQALNYIDNLTHKFLVLGEAVHGEVIEYQIREMLSGKELSRLVTVKDEETGKMASRVVRTPVIVSSVMSGTNHAVNPENASRCFVIHTDESREQTERIQRSQREKYSLERLRSGNEKRNRIIRQHRAAQRLLEKKHIVNEFAPLLDFPTSLMRMRRDHDRFLDLIACVCFLRQYQKKEVHDGEVRYIRCDLEDYRIAYRIMVSAILADTIRELPAGAQLLYEEIREYAQKAAEKQELEVTQVVMTQRQIREYTGLSQTAVRMGIRQLVEYEYLIVSRGGRERSKGFYRLASDESLKGADLSMIPTPDEMRELMKKKKTAPTAQN